MLGIRAAEMALEIAEEHQLQSEIKGAQERLQLFESLKSGVSDDCHQRGGHQQNEDTCLHDKMLYCSGFCNESHLSKFLVTWILHRVLRFWSRFPDNGCLFDICDN